MFWGQVLKGRPIHFVNGSFSDIPAVTEVSKSFHVSRAVLFNPTGFFREGAEDFVRVVVVTGGKTFDICRLYTNRYGHTQVDLDLEFTKGERIQFFTSVHGDSTGMANYEPEIHLTGYHLPEPSSAQ